MHSTWKGRIVEPIILDYAPQEAQAHCGKAASLQGAQEAHGLCEMRRLDVLASAEAGVRCQRQQKEKGAHHGTGGSLR